MSACTMMPQMNGDVMSGVWREPRECERPADGRRAASKQGRRSCQGVSNPSPVDSLTLL